MKHELTLEEKKDLARRCWANPVLFNKTFLKHWFPGDVPWLHWGMLAIFRRKVDFLMECPDLDKIIANFVYKENPLDPNSKELPIFEFVDGKLVAHFSKFTNMIIPRGFSKTTLCNSSTIMDIVYKDRNYILYISESGAHAEQQVRNVKQELEANALIQHVFGELVPGRQDGEKWTDALIQTRNGVSVAGKGRGAQIRGQNIRAQRPDRVIMDDIEDEESVATEEQRQKTLKFMYGSVMPALPKLDATAVIECLGTVLHEEALLMKLAQSTEFTSLVFGALDREGEPLWAANLDKAKLDAMEEQYSLNGQLSVFYREYHSQIRNDKQAKFKNISYFIVPTEEIICRALAMDPAISEKRTADFCGYGVVSMSNKGRIEVSDCFLKRGMTPREQIDKYFELHARWKLPNIICGIEAVQYQAALIHLVTEEMFRKQQYFEIVPIRHTEKKIARVEGVLQPRYAAGYVVHRMKFPLLESQLLNWPNGKKDGPDVIAMAVSLLDPVAHAAATGGFDDLTKPLPPIEEQYGESEVCCP